MSSLRRSPTPRAAAVAVAASFLWAVTVMSSPAVAGGLLVAPPEETVCLLYYVIAKIPVPLDELAAQANSVQRANEFDHAKAVDAEKTRLNALLASLQQVTTIRLNLEMSMGQYDSGLGEYDLSGFSADEFFSFDCFAKYQLRLQFNNAPDAQAWTLAPAEAEAALKRNQGDRHVVAVTTIDVTGADATAPAGQMVMVGNVREVSVVGAYNHAPLGHYVVKAP
jgi:hypothetical protein